MIKLWHRTIPVLLAFVVLAAFSKAFNIRQSGSGTRFVYLCDLIKDAFFKATGKDVPPTIIVPTEPPVHIHHTDCCEKTAVKTTTIVSTTMTTKPTTTIKITTTPKTTTTATTTEKTTEKPQDDAPGEDSDVSLEKSSEEKSTITMSTASTAEPDDNNSMSLSIESKSSSSSESQELQSTPTPKIEQKLTRAPKATFCPRMSEAPDLPTGTLNKFCHKDVNCTIGFHCCLIIQHSTRLPKYVCTRWENHYRDNWNIILHGKTIVEHEKEVSIAFNASLNMVNMAPNISPHVTIQQFNILSNPHWQGMQGQYNYYPQQQQQLLQEKYLLSLKPHLDRILVPLPQMSHYGFGYVIPKPPETYIANVATGKKSVGGYEGTIVGSKGVSISGKIKEIPIKVGTMEASLGLSDTLGKGHNMVVDKFHASINEQSNVHGLWLNHNTFEERYGSSWKCPRSNVILSKGIAPIKCVVDFQCPPSQKCCHIHQLPGSFHCVTPESLLESSYPVELVDQDEVKVAFQREDKVFITVPELLQIYTDNGHVPFTYNFHTRSGKREESGKKTDEEPGLSDEEFAKIYGAKWKCPDVQSYTNVKSANENGKLCKEDANCNNRLFAKCCLVDEDGNPVSRCTDFRKILTDRFPLEIATNVTDAPDLAIRFKHKILVAHPITITNEKNSDLLPRKRQGENYKNGPSYGLEHYEIFNADAYQGMPTKELYRYDSIQVEQSKGKIISFYFRFDDGEQHQEMKYHTEQNQGHLPENEKLSKHNGQHHHVHNKDHDELHKPHDHPYRQDGSHKQHDGPGHDNHNKKRRKGIRGGQDERDKTSNEANESDGSQVAGKKPPRSRDGIAGRAGK